VLKSLILSVIIKNILFYYLFSLLIPSIWAQNSGVEKQVRNNVYVLSSFYPRQNHIIQVQGSHVFQIRKSRLYAGLGVHVNRFQANKPRLEPSSRILRNYQQIDTLGTNQIRVWNTGVFFVARVYLSSRVYFSIQTDIAGVSAGNSYTFQYTTYFNPDLYSNFQDARPTLSGFRNPLFRNIGSLSSQVWCMVRPFRNLEAGVGYVRMRTEYTSSMLLNFRNDRFMLRSDMICFRMGWFFQREFNGNGN